MKVFGESDPRPPYWDQRLFSDEGETGLLLKWSGSRKSIVKF